MNYYIHIPFCQSKCGYCAFYSVTGCGSNEIEAFLNKIKQELEHCSEAADTIYIGGGTPTHLSAKQLEKLFAIIAGVPRKENCEISIESNPETLDADKVSLISEHVTRISLGIQSFDGTLRRTLGRISSDTAIYRAVELIQNVQIPHFNCDLIYGIPGSNCNQWQRDLELVIKCGVDHVSCYNLTPEEQSLLGGTFIIDNDMAFDMYNLAGQILSDNGINRYEISNYASGNAECRHNVNIWRGGRLAAFGPSASGFDGVNRYTAADDINLWLAGKAPEYDVITPVSRCREIFAVNLRSVEGWHKNMWSSFENRVSWQEMINFFTLAMETVPEQFYIIENDTVKLSSQGLLYWNDIAERIIS